MKIRARGETTRCDFLHSLLAHDSVTAIPAASKATMDGQGMGVL